MGKNDHNTCSQKHNIQKSRAEKGIYLNAIAPAKVDTPLQTSINPNASKSDMMTPDYIANYVLRYSDTKVSGHIIYLRVGFDDR